MATPRTQHEPRDPRNGGDRADAPREAEQDTRRDDRAASRTVRDDEHDGGYGDGPL